MDHDQVFKELLQAFFAEFMQLFFAPVAERLDLTRISFLDKELFTDLPKGKQREADLVAQVQTREGNPQIILTHIEVEARRQKHFPERMHRYYMMLRLKHQLPVYPIVIYLAPGAGGLTQERHEERVFEEQIDLFSYHAVGLPDLLADDYDYEQKQNPLAPALSALMKPSRLGSVVQKYRSLRAMALLQVDEARRALLTNVLETYLPLEDEEQEELDRMIAAPEGEEIRAMISVYELRARELGREEGREQGREVGREEGKRDALLLLIRHRFGEPTETARRRVESITDRSELDRLIALAATASSLDELDLS